MRSQKIGSHWIPCEIRAVVKSPSGVPREQIAALHGLRADIAFHSLFPIEKNPASRTSLQDHHAFGM
jgi:hypothetical protein